MSHYVTLSDRASGPQSLGARMATHLIWPESPFPFFLTREPEALAQIAKLLAPKTVLITGAMRLAEPVDPVRPRAFNSIYVLDHDAAIVALYDKVHLVPFGEYLPFGRLLERMGLQTLTKQQDGFLSGDRRRLLTVPGAPPALPLICYEAIFPAEVATSGERPGWIINVTNDGWFTSDGWFSFSTGPYQHFQQARVRAIEQGLPLVRAANTGISAVVDPVGRIISALPLGREGVLDAPLPRPIGRTLYARVGDTTALVFVAVALFAVLRRRMSAGMKKL